MNAVEVVISAKNQASGPIKEVSGDLRGLEGAGSKMGSVLSGVGTVALVGLGAAAVTLGAGLVSSIGKATTFQQAIADVGSLVNATAPQMQALSDAALKLGQDTTLSGIGATDAAAAMAQLAAAGFSVEAMTGGATRGVLLLASATGTDVARAAEIAGDTFNAFRTSMGLTAADMPRIANLFTGAANVSSIGLEDLGESMKYIGPIAASMGISMEDVTAAIAELGNQGIKGSQAGTSLRSIISSLAKPSKEATKVINDLGLSFFDGAGKMKDFSGISGELKAKLSGLTDQQRASALVTLFGNEALSAANVLYGAGAEGIQQYIKDIAEQGDAAAIGAKRNDTLHGSIESLKGSFETAQIALGQAFLPALKELADWAAIGVNAAIPLIQAWGPRLVSGIGSAIGALSTFAGYIGSAVTAMLGAWQKLQAGEITLASFIGGVKTLIATVLGDIGGLLGNVAGFVAPYLAAIGSAITAALPIVGAELGNLASAFGGWIQGSAIPYLQANLPLWLDALAGWVSGTAAPAVASAITSVATAFSGWITGSAIPYVQANLPLWIDAITGWITGTALPAITTAVAQLATGLASWIRGEDATTAFGGWLGAVVQSLANVVGLLSEFVAIAGPKLVEWIKSEETQAQFGALLAAIGVGLADILNAISVFSSDAGVRLHNWIVENAPQWQEGLGNLLAIVNDWGNQISASYLAWESQVKADFNSWLASLLPEWTHSWSAMGDALIAALASMGGALNDWINTAGPDWLHSWSALGEAVTTALGQMVADAGAAMGRLGAAILDGLGSLIPQGGGIAGQIGAAIVQGLVGGIMAGAGQVASAAAAIVTNALQAARNAIQSKSPSRKFMELGQDAIEGLIIGMDQKAGEAAAKSAQIATSVAKAATDILGAIGAIAGYDFAGGSPTGETLGWYRHLAVSIIQTLADVATMLGTDALTNAKKATDATGQIGSAVKSTLEGFKALSSYDFTSGSPTGDAMGWFRHLMESIVLNFAQAAALVGTEGMAQATAFGKTVADVVSASKGALDLFAKLKESEDVPTKALKSLFLALDDALEVAGGLVNQAKLVREDALDFLRIATEAEQAFDKGLQILGGIGKNGAQQAQSAALFVPQAPGVSGGTYTVPGRAAGGPVSAGTLYQVNERAGQTEYFLPNTGGYIMPNGGGFGGGGGGGGANYSVTINVGGSVISEGQLVDKVRAGLLQKGRTVPTLGFN